MSHTVLDRLITKKSYNFDKYINDKVINFFLYTINTCNAIPGIDDKVHIKDIYNSGTYKFNFLQCALENCGIYKVIEYLEDVLEVFSTAKTEDGRSYYIPNFITKMDVFSDKEILEIDMFLADEIYDILEDKGSPSYHRTKNIIPLTFRS